MERQSPMGSEEEDDDDSIGSSDVWIQGGYPDTDAGTMQIGTEAKLVGVGQTVESEGMWMGSFGASPRDDMWWAPTPAQSSGMLGEEQEQDDPIVVAQGKMWGSSEVHRDDSEDDLQALLDGVPLADEVSSGVHSPNGQLQPRHAPIPQWHFSGEGQKINGALPREVDTAAEDSVRMKALLRAKDRLLGEQQVVIDTLTQELEDVAKQRNELQSNCSEWQTSHAHLQSDNDQLRERLAQATATIEALQSQASELQTQLTHAYSSIDELHQRVRDVQSGADVMTAARYEDHLQQLADKNRAELLSACEENNILKKNIAEMEHQLVKATTSAHAAHVQQKPVPSTKCSAAQTISQDDAESKHVLVSTVANNDAQVEEGLLEALHAKLAALECQLKSRDLISTQHGVKGSDGSSCDGATGAVPVPADSRNKSLVEVMQSECRNMQHLIDDLMRSNAELVAANDKLILKAASKATVGGGDGRRGGSTRLNTDDDKALLARWDDAKQSEIRKVIAEMEKEKAEAVRAVMAEQQKAAEAREAQLQTNKEAETKRLRAAWHKNTQESIKAVEDRCARELEEALQKQKQEIADLRDAKNDKLKDAVRIQQVDHKAVVRCSDATSQVSVSVCEASCQCEVEHACMNGTAMMHNSSKHDAHVEVDARNNVVCADVVVHGAGVSEVISLPGSSGGAGEDSRGSKRMLDSHGAVRSHHIMTETVAHQDFCKQSVDVRVTLDMDMPESDCLDAFIDEVRSEVCRAAGVDATRIVLGEINKGSVIINLTIGPPSSPFGDETRCACCAAALLLVHFHDSASGLWQGINLRYVRHVEIVSWLTSCGAYTPSIEPCPTCSSTSGDDTHMSNGTELGCTAPCVCSQTELTLPVDANSSVEVLLAEEKKRLERDAEVQMLQMRKMHLLEKRDAIARIEADFAHETDAELARIRERCEKEMQDELAKALAECHARVEQCRAESEAERERLVAELRNAFEKKMQGDVKKARETVRHAEEAEQQGRDDEDAQRQRADEKAARRSALLEKEEEVRRKEEEDARARCEVFRASIMHEEAQLHAAMDDLRKAKEDLEREREAVLQSAKGRVEEDFAGRIEQELASVRVQHNETLQERVEQAEEELKGKLAALSAEIERQYLARKAEFEELVAKELAANEAIATARSEEALKELRARLAEDRRAASSRAIDNAIQAAVCVRQQTQKILEEELAKEVTVARAAHARKCEEIRTMTREQLQAEEDRTREEMRVERESNLEQLRTQLMYEHEKDAAVLRQEFAEMMEREFGEMQADADKMLAEQHEQHAQRVQKCRDECEASLHAMQDRIQEECKRREAKLRASLEADAKNVLERMEDEMSEMLVCTRREMLRMASAKCQPIYDEYLESLTVSLSKYRVEREIEVERELEEGDKAFDERKEAALRELTLQVRSEITRMLKDLMRRSAQERSKKVADVVSECQAMRARRVRDAEASQEGELERCLREAADAFGEERQREIERVKSEEREQTKQAVVRERQRAEHEEREYLEALQERADEDAKEAIESEHNAHKRRLDKELEALRETLSAERESEVARVRLEVKESIARQEDRLRRQAAVERDRAVQAAKKSCESERVQCLLALESRAQEQLASALAECKAKFASKRDADLKALEARLEQEREDVVASVRDEAERMLAAVLHDTATRLETERGVRLGALRDELSAQRDEALRDLRENMEAETADLIAKVRAEKKEMTRRELDAIAARGEEETATEEKELREKLDAAMHKAMGRLEHEMMERRQYVLSEVESECSEELSQEASRLQKSLRESRTRRIERLRDEKEREAEAAEAEARLRAELELARAVAALREECAADVGRAGVVLGEREEADASAALDVLCETMTRRVHERSAHAEAECARVRDELVGVLRKEWKGMLAASQRVKHPNGASSAPQRTPCSRCVDLEARLAAVQGEDASLRAAVADLKARLEALRSVGGGHASCAEASAVGVVGEGVGTAPRVPPRRVGKGVYVDADVYGASVGREQVSANPAHKPPSHSPSSIIQAGRPSKDQIYPSSSSVSASLLPQSPSSTASADLSAETTQTFASLSMYTTPAKQLRQATGRYSENKLGVEDVWSPASSLPSAAATPSGASISSRFSALSPVMNHASSSNKKPPLSVPQETSRSGRETASLSAGMHQASQRNEDKHIEGGSVIGKKFTGDTVVCASSNLTSGSEDSGGVVDMALCDRDSLDFDEQLDRGMQSAALNAREKGRGTLNAASPSRGTPNAASPSQERDKISPEVASPSQERIKTASPSQDKEVGTPNSASPLQERDRLLFSLLRRSNTRRSLSNMFGTSPARAVGATAATSGHQ